jgi:hypothetical protein
MREGGKEGEWVVVREGRRHQIARIPSLFPSLVFSPPSHLRGVPTDGVDGPGVGMRDDEAGGGGKGGGPQVDDLGK